MYIVLMALLNVHLFRLAALVATNYLLKWNDKKLSSGKVRHR